MADSEIFPCTGYGAARKAGTIVRLRSAPGLDDFVRVDSAIPPFAPDPFMEAEVTQLLSDGTICLDWLDEEGDILASGRVDRRLVEVVKSK